MDSVGDIGANHGVGPFPSAFSGRSPAEIEQDLAIATLVDLRLLHAGKAASLFRARQVSMRRTVALKVLHDELSSDTGQRFDRERATTGQLSGHSGIVPLFDTGSTADGEPYLVMPFYRRGSLADLMTRYGALAWQEATFLLEPVAVTLAEVHGRELVHRNLKPGNILLTDFLLPRVADFGMCLPIGQMSTPATVVEAGAFAPPETANPDAAHPASDVFGLGATLWGLLAGKPPPAVTAPRTALAVVPDSLSHKPPRRWLWQPPSDATPPAIGDLIERSMSPSAEDRPTNAAAFVTELRRCVAKPDRRPSRTLADASATRAKAGTAMPESDGRTDGHTDGRTDGAAAAMPVLDVDRDTVDMTGRATPKVPAPEGLWSTVPEPGAGADPDAASPHIDEKAAADDQAKADGAEGAVEDGPSTELYLLILVALITTGILIMIAAAFLAVQ